MTESNKSSVLFLCTHNSARSQMAEGLLRARHGGQYAVFSAGTDATSVHPLAIEAMAEIGIDLSSHTSKFLTEYYDRHFDWVVTVCDSAKDACPVFPGKVNQVHRSFPDPAETGGSEAYQLEAFRETRDELKAWIDLAFGPGRKSPPNHP